MSCADCPREIERCPQRPALSSPQRKGDSPTFCLLGSAAEVWQRCAVIANNTPRIVQQHQQSTQWKMLEFFLDFVFCFIKTLDRFDLKICFHIIFSEFITIIIAVPKVASRRNNNHRGTKTLRLWLARKVFWLAIPFDLWPFNPRPDCLLQPELLSSLPSSRVGLGCPPATV